MIRKIGVIAVVGIAIVVSWVRAGEADFTSPTFWIWIALFLLLQKLETIESKLEDVESRLEGASDTSGDGDYDSGDDDP